MNPQKPSQTPQARAPAAAPRRKWWARYVVEPGSERPRLVLRWGRILSVMAGICFAGYLSLTTALWGYYSLYRKIPNVQWVDVVVLTRFPRVQAAIGASYFADAKKLWEQKQYLPAIFTARAAVTKSPGNLDARLFLANCWQQAGRGNEAVKVVRDGIAFSATDKRLQSAAVNLCLEDGRFDDLLKMLREDFPNHGVRLLDGKDRLFQQVEVRAVLETAGPTEAARLAVRYPGLADAPGSAPLFAGIDWALDKHDAAFQRIQTALSQTPSDPAIMDNYIDLALRSGKVDEARAKAKSFREAFPNMISAQLRFLEAYGTRQGEDRALWNAECLHFLAEFRHDPSALAQLSSLAASKGWVDLAYLLYQNSLQESLVGFPFAIYYVGSLVKSGDLSGADKAWRDLAAHNPSQVAAATYMAAMVASGNGRQSEAMQVIDDMRRDSADDSRRRRIVEDLFRSFGFPQLADQFVRGHT